jgi:hypothetical protein
MTRVHGYLPDALAEEARAAGLDVSRVAQDALPRELAGRRTSPWLDQLGRLLPSGVTHDAVIDALDTTQADTGDIWPQGRRQGGPG